MTLWQRLVYVYRIIGKLISFATFGLGGFFIASAIFPVLMVFSGFSRQRFSRRARYVVTMAFRVQIWWMSHIVVTMKVDHLERLRGAKSKVVVANHPSLLDVVMLASLLPNADCIVKGDLTKNRFISGIVRNIYIPNCQNLDDQIKLSNESIHDGNCLVVFPEGTRTRPGEPWVFRKGAALFAVEAQCDVIPVYIGGNDKIGLRKFDKLLSFHPSERYSYNMDVLEPISIAPYLEEADHLKAAIRLTKEMKRRLWARHLEETGGNPA